MKKFTLLVLLNSLFALSACQHTGVEKQAATVASAPAEATVAKTTVPKATAHQKAHGAKLADRTDFIEEYGGDKSLTLAQFQQARAQRYASADSNHNGSVDEQEYVDEYAGRLEKKIGNEREGQVKQTHIRFGAVDKNKDKKITYDEFAKSGKTLFEYLDAKHTGIINLQTAEPEEEGFVDRSVLAMPSTHSVKGFLELYDQTGSNQVTLAEFEAQRKAKFNETDTNHDGWLNEDEYVLEFENRLDDQAKKVRTTQLKQAHVRFNALDKDKDKAVSQQEFNASGERIFNGWDLNRDGLVSDVDPVPVAEKMAQSNAAAPAAAPTAKQ